MRPRRLTSRSARSGAWRRPRERVSTATALAEALPRLSVRSLFYHVHEARRRTNGLTDDFSAWLEGYGADAALVTKLREIDFYFLNLNQLRERLLDVLQSLPISETRVKVGAGALAPLPIST